jgi:hypothetical protein
MSWPYPERRQGREEPRDEASVAALLLGAALGYPMAQSGIWPGPVPKLPNPKDWLPRAGRSTWIEEWPDREHTEAAPRSLQFVVLTVAAALGATAMAAAAAPAAINGVARWRSLILIMVPSEFL